jgi:hypothetical protein
MDGFAEGTEIIVAPAALYSHQYDCVVSLWQCVVFKIQPALGTEVLSWVFHGCSTFLVSTYGFIGDVVASTHFTLLSFLALDTSLECILSFSSANRIPQRFTLTLKLLDRAPFFFHVKIYTCPKTTIIPIQRWFNNLKKF